MYTIEIYQNEVPVALELRLSRHESLIDVIVKEHLRYR